MITNMNLLVTTRCPIMCPQCYCSLNTGHDLPKEKALFWIEEARKNGIWNINISGGETLCYQPIIEIVQAISDAGMTAKIATSGYGLDKNMYDRLVGAGIDAICISLNGSTDEVNSASRNGFKYAIQALELLKTSGFPKTILNWVMQDTNSYDFQEYINLAERYGVKIIDVISLKPTSQKEIGHYPTLDQMKYVANCIAKHKGSTKIIVELCYSNLLALMGDLPGICNFNCRETNGCTAGKYTISVNADGKLSPCNHLDYPEEFSSLQEYLRESKVIAELRNVKMVEPCSECYFEKACSHCIAINASRGKGIFRGFEECPMQKEGKHLINYKYHNDLNKMRI